MSPKLARPIGQRIAACVALTAPALVLRLAGVHPPAALSLMAFGTAVVAASFLLVWADNKSTSGTPDLHVSFKMSKSGEALGLYGSDGTPVDFVTYGVQTDDVSEGRYPDGAARFVSTALDVFAADVHQHWSNQPCPIDRDPILPLPESSVEGWR